MPPEVINKPTLKRASNNNAMTSVVCLEIELNLAYHMFAMALTFVIYDDVYHLRCPTTSF